MTKTYDLSGREKGPPKISKLDTINKQINKVIVKDNIIELFIATFTYFKRKSFLAVQDSSIGDIVTHSLIKWHFFILAETLVDTSRHFWETFERL